MTEGIVYVLTNAAMPKMVKIGRTGNDIDQRLSQLYSTGVPLPFECAYAAKVADMDKVEKLSTTPSVLTGLIKNASFSALSQNRQLDCST